MFSHSGNFKSKIKILLLSLQNQPNEIKMMIFRFFHVQLGRMKFPFWRVASHIYPKILNLYINMAKGLYISKFTMIKQLWLLTKVYAVVGSMHCHLQEQKIRNNSCDQVKQYQENKSGYIYSRASFKIKRYIIEAKTQRIILKLDYSYRTHI